MLDQARRRDRPPFRLRAFEPSEFETHISIVDALRKFEAPDCLWLHIGNGEARTVQAGRRLKRMGVRRGAVDLLFIRPGARPLFLEIKTTAGRQSDSQIEFQELAESADAEYAIARSLDAALDLLWRRGFLARRLT